MVLVICVMKLEKMPMAMRMIVSAKKRSTALSGAMLFVAGVNCLESYSAIKDHKGRMKRPIRTELRTRNKAIALEKLDF